MVYLFEEIGADLARPPLAALRALRKVGLQLTGAGWLALPLDARRVVVEVGTRDVVDQRLIHDCIKGPSLQEMRLMPAWEDPDPERVPEALIKALGTERALPVACWRSLTPLDRWTLALLCSNTRLLWRAIEEIRVAAGMSVPLKPWVGWLARCDVRLRADVLERVSGPELLGGRATVLARTSGVRAARRAWETLDLRAQVPTGPVEVEWARDPNGRAITWQAHVSTGDGAFYAAASLLAATTAAVALWDMVSTMDPTAALTAGRLVEEPWLGGSDEDPEEATILCP